MYEKQYPCGNTVRIDPSGIGFLCDFPMKMSFFIEENDAENMSDEKRADVYHEAYCQRC